MNFIDLKTQFQEIGPGVKERFDAIFDHGRYTNGPEVQEFEQRLSEFLKGGEVVGLSNGSDAIVIALLALGIKPGDEVIVPGFTFFSTASMVSLIGAKVVFADVDSKTFCVRAEDIAPLINDKTKAILAVSLYGITPDFDEIMGLASSKGIPVIEDAAQSIGSIDSKGRSSGHFGDISTTSFYPTKPLGCYGEGGACITTNPELAKKIRIIKDHGQTEKYQSEYLGVNGRMASFQAAVLLEKLRVFEGELDRRMELAKRYEEELSSHYEVMRLDGMQRCAYAQFTIQTDDREQVMEYLKQQNVPFAIHYPIPLYAQPIYRNQGYTENLPNCESLSKRVLSIPVHPYLSDQEQTQVIKALKDAR
jgi:UDP-2-acetamido-2-deoxy-ribo-hexuluronate aminotransferase